MPAGIGGPGSPTVAVQDQGPGFGPEALGRGLEPFWSGRAGGTGIGLSVVDEVVRACGGRVRLENAVGGGARVIREWPPAGGGEAPRP